MPIANARVRSPAVLSLLLAPLIHLTVAAAEPAANAITVVYNHIRADSAAELQPGPGFSALVEFNGKVILFDTGGQAETLLRNLQELKKGALHIDAVVISHNHWDHVYGLPGVLSVTRHRPIVYVPGSNRESILQQNPRTTMVGVDEPTQIMPDVWLLGPMQLEYRSTKLAEQALVLDHEDGLIVLVGCSHPGIVKIVERAKELSEDKEVLFVGGGFHLRSMPPDEIRQIASKLRQLGVEQLAPSHCTGEGAANAFRQEWGKKFIPFNLGDSFTF
jgi:7,8-dihydropterin-6-yl-methyl-4-(beta-D-ribofuranosyl)aminobenzene 5'-phosphate synthase